MRSDARTILLLTTLWLLPLGCGEPFTVADPSTPTTTGTGGGSTTSSVGGAGAEGGVGEGGVGEGGVGEGGSSLPQPCYPAGVQDSFEGDLVSPSLWKPWIWPQGSGSSYGVGGGVAFIRLELTSGTYSEAGFETLAAHPLTGCSVWIEAKKLMGETAPAEAYFGIWPVGAADQTGLFIGVDWGTLLMGSWHENQPIEVQDTPFVPGEHRWWRIREAEGTVFFETSADGWQYVPHHQIFAPAYVASATIGFYGGIWEAGSSVRLEFDNFNVMPER